MRVDGAKTAALAMVEAHAAMYDAIHKGDPGSKVGLVYSFADVVPNTDSADDKRATEHADYFINHLFMDGVAQGKVDEKWDGHQVVRPDLVGKMDYIGVNYYDRFHAKPGSWTKLLTGGISPLMDFDPSSGMDGTPKGINPVLHKVADRWKLPIYITETGADQGPDQNAGAAWMVQTLEGVKQARQEGVDVRGYFAWSLMDNYEWNHGMNMKFGLYSVDTNTKRRTLRPAGAAIAEMGKARDIPADLSAKYASFFR
jgi:beta-glucosidase/6-phospho-beta-glucosidase/beta-galactosidase